MAAILAPAGAQASMATPLVRTSAQKVAHRLLKKSVREIAEALQKDESTASRVRAGERAITIQEFCDLLSLIGFKLVDTNMQCVPADELAMLRRCYAAHHNVDLFSDPE